MGWKNNVVRSFDRKSAAYDQNCSVQQSIALRLAADLPVSDEVTDILEIGCGTGNLTQHLFRQYEGCNLRITDVSPAMVERAKAKFSGKEACWSVMDGENSDNTDTYDLIVSNMAFQWFEDIGAAVERLSSMLKPNGSLFYTMPGNKSFCEWKQVLTDLNLSIGILDFPTSSDIYREENIMHDYKGAVDFLRSMKNIGAGTARKDYTPLTHSEMKQACAALDRNHGGKTTWHVLYGRIDK
ncbi:MAG: biotin biosynthesis protein [Alphaproteobacteria bacterium]|nr:MAG: biotin biosynthesis protein [Alphaproteobacteria bacterium]